MKPLFWGLLAGLVIGGAGWLSAPAHADPATFEPEVVTYTAQHGRDVCTQLAAEPNNDGVSMIGLRIVNGSKLTTMQAGEVIGLAVRTYCIQYAPQVARFAASVQGVIA